MSKSTTQRYDVERVTQWMERLPVGRFLSKRDAIALARQQAADYPDCNVYVSWGRASDGQQGYLNPDGNHNITGQAW